MCNLAQQDFRELENHNTRDTRAALGLVCGVDYLTRYKRGKKRKKDRMRDWYQREGSKRQ